MTTPTILPVMIGVDPEIAVRSIEQDRFVSAHDLVPGTKYEPHPVSSGQVLVDGTMLEYGIEPARTPEEFVNSNTVVLAKLQEMIGPKYEMVFDQSVFFDKFYMDKLPDPVKELGCSADFNAWDGGRMNPAPAPKGVYANMRACGGHIHLSWTKDADIESVHHVWDCVQIIKQLDTWIHPYLSLLEEDDDPRRVVYGGLGSFRPKPYGVEWRVPSNAWLKHKNIWPWLFNAVKFIVERALDGTLPYIKDRSILNCRMDLVKDQGTHYIKAYDNSPYSRENYLGMLRFPSFPVLVKSLHYASKPGTIKQGIRIAHSAETVDYDVNLDWELVDRESQNYSDEAPDSNVLRMY